MRSSPILARNPAISSGRYCMRRSRVLIRRVSWSTVRLARLARLGLRWDHTASTGLSSRGVGGQWVDRQPVPSLDQPAHHPAEVRVQIVPDQDNRPTQLLVSGIEQGGVVGFGEPLLLFLASSVHPGPEDQSAWPVGFGGHQPGDRDPARGRRTHLHHRGVSAPAPGPSARRPQGLPGLVFEDQPGALGRRDLCTAGQVSARHAWIFVSSRSVARRVGACPEQPMRCSR